MSNDWQSHVVHAAMNEKGSKTAAVILIIMGFFFTPMLIGIPMMLFGLYRLFK